MIDRNSFIKAMRGVAQSVTVVSTDGQAGRHGATVSAFCSVSADPPKALVCLNASSKISELVIANGTFAVSVLPECSKSLADRFAGLHDHAITNRFDGIETFENGGLAIEGTTVFNCSIDEIVTSGSHKVIIGNVLSCDAGGKNPLTYLDGAYHQVARFPEAAE